MENAKTIVGIADCWSKFEAGTTKKKKSSTHSHDRDFPSNN
jgi:hypothetical protein